MPLDLSRTNSLGLLRRGLLGTATYLDLLHAVRYINRFSEIIYTISLRLNLNSHKHVKSVQGWVDS